MANNRQKGKRIERWFVNSGLKKIFPDIRRNANEQSQQGGRDLLETGDFNFEVKGGKKYKSKMVRDIIDQCESQRGVCKYSVSLVKPDREDAYVILPFDDFLKILEIITKMS